MDQSSLFTQVTGHWALKGKELTFRGNINIQCNVKLWWMTVVSSQCFNITIQTLIHCMQNNHVKWLIINENKVHWKRLLTTCTYVCIILLFHFLKIWIKASELMEFWIHCGCKKNKSQCNGYMHTLILYSSISHKMLMYSLARLCSIWWDLRVPVTRVKHSSKSWVV